MVSSALEPVYYDWRTRLQNHVALVKEATMNGDTAVLAALRVQNQSSSVDSLATLYKNAEAYGSNVLDHTKQIMNNLENKAKDGVKDTKAGSDDVKNNMDALQKSPEGQKKESWRNRLRRDIAKQKEDSGKRWDALGKYAEDQIDKLPDEDSKNDAVDFFKLATDAIGVFVDKAIKWLENAIDTIEEWFRKAWEAVKEFAQKVGNWFVTAWNAVKDAFSGKSVAISSSSVCSVDPEEDFTPINVLPNLEDITSKLKDTGLDNITLVRKGASWIMEVPV